MCPPLLTRNVVINKGKHTHTNAGVNNKLTGGKKHKELEQEEEEELLNSESERKHSDSLSHDHHKHRHHHRHRHSNQHGSISTSALDNDVDSDNENEINRTAMSEIIEYDLTDPVEYHKITFLSSDESDDENSHHAAYTRRAVMQGNMASFSQFSFNETSNGNDNDVNNLDSHNNKHNGSVNDEQELEQNTQDDMSTSKKNRKRRDEKRKHRRSKIDMTSVEYASSNFAPLSMQHENEFEETADVNADSQNKMSNTEPLDTLDSNYVNTQNALSNVLVNTLVSVNETDRNEHEQEQEEQKETRHKHRKRHHHHHHHQNDNNREDNNINDIESENATPVTQQSSSENIKTNDNSSTAIATRHSVPTVISVPPSVNMDSQLADKESNSQINNHGNSVSKSNNNTSSMSSSSSSMEAQGNSSTLVSDVAKTNDEAVSTNNQSANNEQQGNSASTGVHPHPQRREDMCYLMQVYDSPTLVQDLLKFLRTGTPMMKHGRQGKPHRRLF